MSGNLSDQEFETGVRLIREAYTRKLAHKETELLQVRSELARKEADIKELTLRVTQLETQLVKSERKQQELSKQAAKLQHFRQVVLESFTQDGSPAVPTAEQQSVLFGNSVSEEPALQQSPALSSLGRNTGKTNFDFSVNSPNSPSLQTHPQLQTKDYRSQTQTYQQTVQEEQQQQHLQQQHINNNVERPRQSHRPSTTTAATNTTTQPIRQHVIQEEHESPFPSNRALNKQASSLANSLNQPSRPHTSTTHSGKPSETVVDGREFFRRAKSILSYDDFTHLLWNVKAYNNRDQSRSRTLENVFQTIGHKHPTIHEEFERLLSR